MEELSQFLKQEFPQTECTIVRLGDKSATVRHPIGIDQLRPGGTVSGPVLMETADVAMYVAILNEIGIVPLAVTTNLNINFLSKPDNDRDIVGTCHLLKVGKKLIVGEITLYSDGSDVPVAHATATYSVPPR